MARFGAFRYGTALYGSVERGVASSYLDAVAVDYGKVEITVLSDTRIGMGYMLVRTNTGAAEEPGSGLVVSAGVITATQFEVEDSPQFPLQDPYPAPEGQVYYTLFVFDSSGRWLKDAATSIVAPIDYRSLGFLVESLPRVMTSETGNPLDGIDPDSDLIRFLGGFAVTYDELKTYLKQVTPYGSRTGKSLRGLHNVQALSVGMNADFTLGSGSTSRLFQNAGFIYRSKGTVDGLRTYVEALTNWPTEVYESPNLLKSVEDSSFEGSTGYWGISGGGLDVLPPDALYPVPDSGHDYELFPFAREGLGRISLDDPTVVLSLPEDLASSSASGSSTGREPLFRSRCAYIRGLSDCYISAWFRPHTVVGNVSITVSARWINAYGEEISVSDADTVDFDSTWNTWQQVSFAAQPPTGAAFVQIKFTVAGTADDVVLVDRVQVSGDDTHYHDPKTPTIVCAPSRVNLIDSGGFELDSPWEVISGSAATTSDESAVGSFSLRMSDPEFFELSSPEIPAKPLLLYTFSAYFKGDPCSVFVDFLDSDGNLLTEPTPLATYDPSQFTEEEAALDIGPATFLLVEPPYEYTVDFPGSSEEFERLSLTSLSPEGTASVVYRIEGEGTTLLDAVLIEQSDMESVFFDISSGDQADEDVLPALNAPETLRFAALYPNRLSKMNRLVQGLPQYLPVGVNPRVLLWDASDPVVRDYTPYGNYRASANLTS